MSNFEGLELSPDMFDHLIGQSLAPRTMDYTYRDVSMYALGVGCHLDDLPYYFEKRPEGLKALPTFALLPYINNITVNPVTPLPDGTNEIVRNWLERKLGRMPSGLHMAMDLQIKGPIDPYKGTFLMKDVLNNVYDRGEGKGIVSDCSMEVFDIAGRPVAELHSYHVNFACGGFGGPKFVSPKVAYPDREPDHVTTEYMVENIAAIYRMTGDTYPVHIDQALAESYGYPKPFIMGLCTYGFASRIVIQQYIPYQPERVKHIYAQIRNVCYPGRNCTVKSWEVEPGKIVYQMFDEEDRLLLGNCVLEYE